MEQYNAEASLSLPLSLTLTKFIGKPNYFTFYVDGRTPYAFWKQHEFCNLKVYFVLSHMVPQRISGPESFVAKIARDCYTLQMVGLYVIFHIS